jgi:nucleolar protein 14
MAHGSQLAQLKRSLSDADLSRTSHSRSNKKRRSASQESLKATALKQIREKLNPFDQKVTKLKHDVGGRVIKGRIGKPTFKRQAGIEEVGV